MQKLLMIAAAVTGISVTGLTGSADAGYPARVPVTQTYVVKHGNHFHSRYGWNDYRSPAPRRNVYRALPYKYGHDCNTNYGYFGGYGRNGIGNNWRW
jgi:hypothetical protein